MPKGNTTYNNDSVSKIELDSLQAGTHEFQINVPDAVFYGEDGHFPISAHIQGISEKTVGIKSIDNLNAFSFYPNPSTNNIFIESKFKINSIDVINTIGQILFNTINNSINISELAVGIYFIQVNFNDGRTAVQSFVKN